MVKKKHLAIGVVIGAAFLLGLYAPWHWYDGDLTSPRKSVQKSASESSGSTRRTEQAKSDKFARAPSILRELEDILNSSSEFERRYLAYVLVANTNENELPDLFGEASSISRASDRQVIAGIILQRLAEYNPELALTLLQQNEKFEPTVFVPYLSPVFYSLARMDLDLAIEYAKSLQDQDLRFTVFSTILNSRDDFSNDELLQLARRIDDPRLTYYLNAKSEQKEIQQNPEAAWRDAIVIYNDRERYQTLSNIANIWTEKNPLAVLQAAALIKDVNNRNNIMSTVLTQWLVDDPEEAIDWINHDQLLENKEFLMRGSFWRLANRGPRHAIDLIRNIDSDIYQSIALEAVVGDWYRDDLQAALHWVLQESGDLSLSDSLYRGLLGEYAKKNPGESFNLLFSLPLDDRSRAIEEIARKINKSDMQLYAAQLARFENDDDRIMATSYYLFQWSRNSPAEAATWLTKQNLGNSVETRIIYREAFIKLAEYDFDEAQKLVVNMAPSPQRDAAILGALELVETERLPSSRLPNLISDRRLRARIRSVINSSDLKLIAE